MIGFELGADKWKRDHEVPQLKDGGSERYDATSVEQDVSGNRWAKTNGIPIRSLTGLARHRWD